MKLTTFLGKSIEKLRREDPAWRKGKLFSNTRKFITALTDLILTGEGPTLDDCIPSNLSLGNGQMEYAMTHRENLILAVQQAHRVEFHLNETGMVEASLALHLMIHGKGKDSCVFHAIYWLDSQALRKYEQVLPKKH